MSQKPVQTMIRLPRPLVERVETWAQLMGTTKAKVIGLAVSHWESQAPVEPFGITPSSAPDAPHKADD